MAANEPCTVLVAWNRMEQKLHIRIYNGDGRLVEEKTCNNTKQLVLQGITEATLPGGSIDTRWVVVVMKGVAHVECTPPYTIVRSEEHGHGTTTCREE